MGDLRLRLPQPVRPYNGTINATAFGNQCLQQTFPSVALPSSVPAAAGEYAGNFLGSTTVPTSEDCAWLEAWLWFTLLLLLIDVSVFVSGLNLNVIVPANATAESKLPVAVVRSGYISHNSDILLNVSFSGFSEVRSRFTHQRHTY